MWHDCDLAWQNRQPSHPRRGKVRTLRERGSNSRRVSGKSTTGHRILALNRFTCLAGGDTSRSGENHFIYNKLRLLGVFFEIVGECFADCLVDGTHHLTISEFCLGLSLKLGLGHLDTDHRRETFAEVIPL